jgi:hypothetical protein
MSGADFHLTRMGARYYEHTVPELVAQLLRLNNVLERVATAVEHDAAERRDEAPGAEPEVDVDKVKR